MVDLRAQYLRIKNEIDAAMAAVVDVTVTKGPCDCGRFEKEFADFCEVAACVGVANGTDALIYALRAYGVGTGDEVVTVANTFIATGEAILLNGARRCLWTSTMSPTPSTRANSPPRSRRRRR